jgi:biopolymer transport protein ExbB
MNKRTWFFAILVIWTIWQVIAQDAAAPPADASAAPVAIAPAPAAPEPVPPDEKLTLLQLIKAGGLTMVFLGLLSVAVVALAIRNHLTLKIDRLLRPDIVPALNQQMAEGDIAGALMTCRSQDCMLSSVLAHGLLRIVDQEIVVENVEKGFMQEGQEQMTNCMKPINYLLTIGSIAPMLGLLGTVSGMIKAFQNISAGGMGKPEMLAENIGEALVTTATGLIIAIPAMLFYYYYKNAFATIISRLNKYLGGLLNSLERGKLTPIELSDIPVAPGLPQAETYEQG